VYVPATKTKTKTKAQTKAKANAAPSGLREQPRAYHHGDLRAVLVDEALALIAAEGSERFTLREIARRAGVSHTAPYRHFPTKAALLGAIAGAGSTLLRASIERALESAADAREQFLAAGMAYVRFALEHRAHFEVMFFVERAYESDAEAAAARDASWSLLPAFIRDAQRRGAMRRGDPAKIAIAVWGMHHGLACLALGGHFDTSPRALRRTVEDAHRDLLDGLVPRE
jgi:AcrR family transcriptional regulator